MNVLKIQARELSYSGSDGKPSNTTQHDFLIDGVSLAEVFKFENDRPWFGATFLELNNEAKSQELSAFLGKEKPNNQFGTDRLVLYRCHCGSDYCGVISCEVKKNDHEISWLDIRFEENDKPTIGKYTFNYQSYTELIKQHAKST